MTKQDESPRRVKPSYVRSPEHLTADPPTPLTAEQVDAWLRSFPDKRARGPETYPRMVGIVRARYGQAVPQTLDQLAEEFGLQRERVRQLESEALFRLRRLRARGALDQLDPTTRLVRVLDRLNQEYVTRGLPVDPLARSSGL